MIVIIWIFNVLEWDVSDWSVSAFTFVFVWFPWVFLWICVVFLYPAVWGLVPESRTELWSWPDLLSGGKQTPIHSLSWVFLGTPSVWPLSCPPLGVLHGDLLWAGAGLVEPKVSGYSEGPGAPHPGSLRGGPVQIGCDWFHRHPGPDGRWQQSSVSVS